MRILQSPRDQEGGGGHYRLASIDRVYHGLRNPNGGVDVWSTDPKESPESNKCTLPMHLEVRSHSPTGFSWGYGGSGPAQLALALLVDALGDATLAELHYQGFKFRYVANWGDSWSITAREIHEFVRRAEGRPARSDFVGFPSGAIVATANAIERVSAEDIRAGLRRHLSGDWGELDREDWEANERALANGTRLVSAYTAKDGERFWIITEWDRSYTTILLPQDY